MSASYKGKRKRRSGKHEKRPVACGNIRFCERCVVLISPCVCCDEPAVECPACGGAVVRP